MSRTQGAQKALRISPYSRRLRLGAELRELRQGQGKAMTAVADAAGIDRTLLTRIETGQRRVKPDQIMRIAESLGVTVHTQRWQQLYQLARDADTSGWWEAREYRDMGSRQVLPADLEAGSSRLRWYDFALVPGLLQSPAYVRARHVAPIASAPVVDVPAAIRGRERRQQEVLRPGGPQIEAIVEETVIRRLMVPADAMVEQLHHLLKLMDTQPQVSVRVLPVGGELIGVRAPRSPLTLYDFATGDPSATVVEALTEDVLLRDQAAVADHELLWSRLADSALSQDQTRVLIADTAQALAKQERRVGANE